MCLLHMLGGVTHVDLLLGSVYKCKILVTLCKMFMSEAKVTPFGTSNKCISPEVKIRFHLSHICVPFNKFTLKSLLLLGKDMDPEANPQVQTGCHLLSTVTSPHISSIAHRLHGQLFFSLLHTQHFSRT